MPQNHILRKCTSRYKLYKLKEKFNHLIYMDDIKLFAKNEKELETPNTGSEDIQWRYRDGIWHRKCAMLIMKSGKWQMMEGIELLKQVKIRTFREQEILKYLGILGADTIKKAEM